MGMRFQILGSSSSGNCALLTTPECRVLIDAGFSARRLSAMLAAVGESLDSIDAVFLTHEHSDHTVGLRGISRHPKIELFANRDTAFAVGEGLPKSKSATGRKLNWKLFETGDTFRYRDLEVTSFSVPHDAHDPVGFVIGHQGSGVGGEHKRLAWLTDLGYVPAMVRERVRDADVLVVESNYDDELLDSDTKRPWSVKQRIRGRHGHLSNHAVFELLTAAESPRWREVFLAHLSRDCNSMAAVDRTFGDLRHGGGRFHLHVVDPENGTLPACHFR